ncbi:tetratricopeptide repeat protein [Azospirillum halopraeferens]|uniref:tetratricopeptide repeat protein n=1 Tax=Azospirillum halopraeferens TaxID=34010 RepID=UPI0004091245|nr:tetratricopeptide repeat-containing glycosyltransferase family protein [Azospirillum halopraeferens]
MSGTTERSVSLRDAMALGKRTMARGEYERAAELYRQIIRARPDHIPALAERARALQHLYRFDLATGLLGTALAQRPDSAKLWFNLGNARRGAGDQDAALDAYRRAVALAPNEDEMQVGLGLALMQAGAWSEGFAHYERRYARREFLKWMESAGRPVWSGEALDGRTILLVAEQGIGDTIQFVRYAGLLADRGARVVVNCQPPLRALLETARGVSAVATGRLNGFDTAEMLMSLPARFGTTPDTVPAPIPYLAAPATPAVTLPDRGRPRVGLVWAGNPRHVRDAWRSIPFSTFARLLDVPGIDFYALQKDAVADDPRMEPLGPRLADFAVTASVVAQLDLVITVDTSVAHLAGAMGKPVWILLAARSDWRWLTGRSDSPWYPTARLFRQEALGDWPPLIEAVAAALATRPGR